MPLVSIIIPYFNRSVLLQQTIQSILDQTYKHWEIIIIDDGSDKSELDILYYYALQDNIRVLFRTKEKKGPSSCRNIGIKNAKGNYIIFIDSDDLIGPYCLENRVKKMQIDSSLNLADKLVIELGCPVAKFRKS